MFSIALESPDKSSKIFSSNQQTLNLQERNDWIGGFEISSRGQIISQHLFLYRYNKGGCGGWIVAYEHPMQCRGEGAVGNNYCHWVGKIPWRQKWQPTPISLPGKSKGQMSLVGYSPWGHKRVGLDFATKQQNNTINPFGVSRLDQILFFFSFFLNFILFLNFT